MANAAAQYLSEQRIGPVERRVPLDGRLPAGAGAEAPVELCLTPQGAWLVAAAGRFVGQAVEVGDTERVRYVPGRVRDRLLLDGAPLAVRPGRAGEARRCIALGRIRKGAGRIVPRLDERDRYLPELSAPLRELVAAELAPAEIVIAVQPLVAGRTVRSALGADVEEESSFVLTSERALIVALSELGDAQVRALDASALSLATRDGEVDLVAGTERWPIAARDRLRAAELARLAALAPGRRLYGAARALWLERSRQPPARVSLLLDAACERGELLALGARALLACEARSPLERSHIAPLRGGLAESAAPPDLLSTVFVEWELSPGAGLRAVELLSELAPVEPWALGLHRAAHAAEPANGGTLALARHEVRVGDPGRARALAERRLAALGPDEDSVLEPNSLGPHGAERLGLLEVLLDEAGRQGHSELAAHAALARLEPLSRHRLEALAASRPGDAREQRFAERARAALACLEPGGLAGAPPAPDLEPPAALGELTLRERVAHPLARGSGLLAGRLSELVAAAPEPELGFLRDFCEELVEARHPDAARALLRARRLLGLGMVRAYVSHGARSVGVRAFGEREAFVLIGESHVGSDGAFVLRGRELDFAFGAELSHVAFGHQRVTASEVWAGATSKTRDLLLALGVVLPLVREIGGPRAWRALGKLSPETLAAATRAAERLGQLFSHVRPGSEASLGRRNEELIAAHRLVQLSADRAGLVAAESLRAALRAMLLTRADYRELLGGGFERGLAAALDERPRESEPLGDLLVRTRALVAFYLSADFDELIPRLAESAEG